MSKPAPNISVNAIARKINLSPSTVSRALRGHPAISEATCRKVRKAADEAGYVPNKSFQRYFKTMHRPNPTVALLVSQEHHNLAYSRQDEFFLRLYMAIQSALRAQGMHMVLASTPTDVMEDGNLFAVDEGVAEGVITNQDDNAMIAALAKHTPVVVINQDTLCRHADVVLPDVARCVMDQVDYLRQRGHRRIACFRVRYTAGLHVCKWQDRRFWQEYEQYLRELGLPLPPQYLEPNDWQPYHHDQAVAAFIDRVFQPGIAPTAILTYDLYARQLIEQLGRRGVRVPEDVSIIGFDDATHNEPASLALTTFRQDFDAMARAAVRLLRERLREPEKPTEFVEIGGQLVERDSVAACRD
ncbi:MAG: LacI family DNA-binding transcriptional regulator [Phycisphaeraceae bacterium]|nr:LacI family DNA-binding transcriptional regulator [Phycisphaeraceae bacterium]